MKYCVECFKLLHYTQEHRKKRVVALRFISGYNYDWWCENHGPWRIKWFSINIAAGVSSWIIILVIVLHQKENIIIPAQYAVMINMHKQLVGVIEFNLTLKFCTGCYELTNQFAGPKCKCRCCRKNNATWKRGKRKRWNIVLGVMRF